MYRREGLYYLDNNHTTTIVFDNGNVAVISNKLIQVTCCNDYNARKILEKEYKRVAGNKKRAHVRKSTVLGDIQYLINALK